ncbi:MAG: 6-bladed beta-propeller [Candidatus Paceibacterota bacterium]
MTSKMKWLLFILFLIIFGCENSDSKPELLYGRRQLKTIIIDGNFDEFIPNDKVFKNIQIVPLETNDQCIIMSIFKAIIKDEFIIIQNSRRSILVFNIKGKFIRQIGFQGKGPGEYLSALDFDVDDKLNLYICDGFKILVYSIDGKLLESYPIDCKISGITLHPEQIIANQDGGYYFWKTFENQGLKERNQYSLIRIDKKQKIISNHIPLKRNVYNNPDRFHKFDTYYNIDPPFGLDTIYAISDSGFFANYYLDFGERKLPKPIPEWEEFGEYVKNIQEKNYVTNVLKFVETDEWVFFRFTLNKYMYNATYSKMDNEIFISKPDRDDPPQKSLMIKIDGEWDGKVFSYIEPLYLHEKVELMDNPQWKGNLTHEDIKLKNIISRVPISNNPIFLIAELK